MEPEHRYRQALQKAEQLFAKKNFPAARKEFERARRLHASDDILARIRACEERIDLAQRKEWIKKGRRLEKKGDLDSALDCFSRALHNQAEEWLENKVAQLRRRQGTHRQATVFARIAEIAEPAERLSAYDRALDESQDARLKEGQASCLVELGRYAEALAVYEEQAPATSQGRYDLGYALIALGHYHRGLSQWEPLLKDHGRLLAQIDACLPYLVRELAPIGHGYALPHRILSRLDRSPLRERYRTYISCRYIEELWNEGRYERIPEIVSSLPEPLAPPLLARLYFALAARDVEYLQAAISYWLTAIYDERQLNALQVHRAIADPPDNPTLRTGLLKLLEEQVAAHNRAGRLTPALESHWLTERRQIERLAALPIEHSDLELFPCTPAFARALSLNEEILHRLREQRPTLGLDAAAWLELSASYSRLGRYLDWIDPGEEDKVFNALPAKATDAPSDYLRQRIAWRCGINRIRAGGRQTRKYFQAALPLLKGTPHLAQELIDLSYSEPSDQVNSALSEAMEFLSAHLREPRFLEATAHCIGRDVEHLLLQGVKPASVEKRLKKARAIYPDSPQVQTLLATTRRTQTYERLAKAFKGGDLNKAAAIVRAADDSNIEGYFFKAMEGWYQDLLQAEHGKRRIAELRSIFQNCRYVDPTHPFTRKLAADLAALGAD